MAASETRNVAPVHGFVEARDSLVHVWVVLIGLQQVDALGAGEETLRVRDCAARRHVAPLAAISGAIVKLAIDAAAVEIAADRFVLIRDQRGEPIVIGEAEPAARAVGVENVRRPRAILPRVAYRARDLRP